MTFKNLLNQHIDQCLRNVQVFAGMDDLSDAAITQGIWILRLENQSADDFYVAATNARDYEIEIDGLDVKPMRQEFSKLLLDCISDRVQELNELRRLLDANARVSVQRVEKACMILKLSDVEGDALHVAAIRAQNPLPPQDG